MNHKKAKAHLQSPSHQKAIAPKIVGFPSMNQRLRQSPLILRDSAFVEWNVIPQFFNGSLDYFCLEPLGNLAGQNF